MKHIYNNILRFIVLIFLFSIAGCAATMLPPDIPDIEIPDGKAAIFFFRPDKIGGGAIKFHVHNMEGKPVGYLGKAGERFWIIVEPGRRQYWSRAAQRNEVILNVEAGKKYYVQGSVNMGFPIGRPVLKDVTSEVK